MPWIAESTPSSLISTNLHWSCCLYNFFLDNRHYYFPRNSSLYFSYSNRSDTRWFMELNFSQRFGWEYSFFVILANGFCSSKTLSCRLSASSFDGLADSFVLKHGFWWWYYQVLSLVLHSLDHTKELCREFWTWFRMFLKFICEIRHFVT